MTDARIDGRRFVPEVEARSERQDDGRFALFAPQPGHFRSAALPGGLVAAGSVIGDLEVLGVLHRVRAPRDAFGLVGGFAPGRRLARRAVDCGTCLLTLDPEGVSGEALVGAGPDDVLASGRPVFRTPLGGRYYARPSPDAEPFVGVGQDLVPGQAVALIEVMKTFNRVQYTGPSGRVAALSVKDGVDVEAGDVLFELEES